MGKLDLYIIPHEIYQIEFNGNKEELEKLKSFMPEFRKKESIYVSLFIAMINLEESVNSRHIQQYNIKCVQLLPHKLETQEFKVEYNVRFI